MKIASLVLAAFIAFPGLIHAQIITTVAGGYGDGGLAANARLVLPAAIAIDAAGNYLVTDGLANFIRRIDATTGIVTSIAGNELFPQLYANGARAAGASIWLPRGIVVDAPGNVYFIEANSDRIGRIDATTGILTTFAGNGPYNYSSPLGDGGPAVAANIAEPRGLALDGAGNLYILQDRDLVNHESGRVRRVDAATGTITTVAGGGPFENDGGPATSAYLNNPVLDVAIDAASNLYIPDPYLRAIRRVDAATGIISRAALLPDSPESLTLNAAGELFVALPGSVQRVTLPGGSLTPVAGTGAIGFGGDGGPATAALFNTIENVRFDGAGRMLIVDSGNARVRRVEGGTVTTIMGRGPYPLGDGTPSPASILVGPNDVAFDGQGNLLIADHEGHRIRRVLAANGFIETIAGTGAASFAPDGSDAASSPITSPSGVAVDAGGNVHFVDGSTRIRRIDAASGKLSTVVGAAGINQATAIVFDPAGNIYFTDFGAHRVRRVDATTGAITNVAGDGTPGLAGDGGAATQAKLNSPASLTFDPAGNLVVSDTLNSRVRRIDKATGVITTIAGSTTGLSGDGGPATSAQMSGPWGVAYDAAGNLFIADRGNGRVRAVLAANGKIIAIAGGGNATIEGDFPTRFALLLPQGIAFGPSGDLYVAEWHPSRPRVRRISLHGLWIDPGALSFDARLPATTSLSRRVTLTNLDAATTAVPAFGIVGAAFAMTSDCAAPLASGASCGIDVTFTPAAVGSARGTLTVQGANPIAIDLSGAGELSLVTFYYESILRRAPDTTGYNFWTGERARMQASGANVNETWFAMSSSFVTSAEYASFNRDATGFTTDLYKTFFNRAPDAPGQQFWIDQMANGMPREAVLASFQLSQEFKDFTQGLFGNTAARVEIDMVMDLYRGLFGRLPDDSGFRAWVANMRAAQCQDAAAVAAKAEFISEQFATSPEYVNKNRTDAQYVGDLYNAFLRRGGDLASVVTWINSLNGTFTRKQLRDNFRASPEFQGRVQAVVAQGCLP